MHYTWLELDRERVGENINRIRRSIGDREMLAVVKANGYGLGAVAYTKLLKSFGIMWFGVASIKEGMALRDAGIHAAILIQAEPFDSPPEEVVDYQLIPTLYTLEYATALNHLAKSRGIRIPVHLKIDTGMARLGIRWTEYPDFIRQLVALDVLEITGLFTHYANSEIHQDPFTQVQLDRFQEVLTVTESVGIRPRWIHAANSAGVCNAPLTGQTMVRLGVGLTEDAVQIKSRVVGIKQVQAGDPVSYSGRFIAHEPTWIAVVGTGYSDGLPTSIQSPEVIINGEKYPVVGTICMDMVMVNLGEKTPQIARGDEVVWIGQQKEKSISMADFCRKSGKNPREITCNFGARCPTRFL